MGAYTEIVDFTFTANETSRTFSGLSITKDDFVKVVATRTRQSGASFLVSMFPNNETTATHYHTQSMEAGGTSVGASRTNDNKAFTSGAVSSHFIYVKLSENDRFNFFANSTVANNSSVGILFSYVTSSGVTFPNGITSLTFSGNMVTGDRIQIYKLAAIKVADITVASNTTQVDISNLSIDKDSEYLLVTDFVNPTSGGGGIFIYPNDLTTASNYYYQLLGASGSSTVVERQNYPNFIGSAAGLRGLGYAHIKLSNIGAFTVQTFHIQSMGTSSLTINNAAISSTSEAITSITKINLVGSVTNYIGAGSRFHLYKLYE